MVGWVGVKSVLRIAYSNPKSLVLGKINWWVEMMGGWMGVKAG